MEDEEAVSLVREFHEAFDLPRPEHAPLVLDPDLVRLRLRLIREEYEEVRTELEILAYSKNPTLVNETLARLLKELADLRYVVEGCAVAFGLPFEEAFEEVHRSNMSKLDENGKPLYREDGKVMKSPLYQEADMTNLVQPILDADAAA